MSRCPATQGRVRPKDGRVDSWRCIRQRGHSGSCALNENVHRQWNGPGMYVIVSPPHRWSVCYIKEDLATPRGTLYVGESRDPGMRFRSHERHSEWFSLPGNLTAITCGSRAERKATEAFLIQQLQPSYNIQGVPRKAKA